MTAIVFAQLVYYILLSASIHALAAAIFITLATSKLTALILTYCVVVAIPEIAIQALPF